MLSILSAAWHDGSAVGYAFFALCGIMPCVLGVIALVSLMDSITFKGETK